jgi:hypothetical protein
MTRVLPMRTNRGRDAVQSVDHGVSHREAGGLKLSHQKRFDVQTRCGQCSPAQGPQGLTSYERLSRPLDAKRAKQRMLKRGPLRSPGRVMTHRHLPAEGIGHPFLKGVFP